MLVAVNYYIMNNLTIKKFEKAKNLHDEILSIDSEIMQIEKLANEAANDNCKLSFNVKVENYSKTKEEKKDIFTDDNSLSGLYSRLIWPSFGMQTNSENKTHTDEYKFGFTDTDCLNVLSVLLKLKYDKRNKIIEEIQKLGVSF